jgi:hypothetical protein
VKHVLIFVATWLFAHPYLCSVAILLLWIRVCNLNSNPFVLLCLAEGFYRGWMWKWRRLQKQREAGLPESNADRLVLQHITGQIILFDRIRREQRNRLKSERSTQ